MRNNEASKKNNKHLIIGIAIIIVAILAMMGYFKYNEVYPSTDNAYVSANLVDVVPKVNGYIKEIYVKENQKVKKGELLLSIDSKDYDLAYEQAKKNYDSQVSQSNMAKQQLEVQKDQIEKDKVQYEFALNQKDRYQSLYAANTVSLQSYQNIATQYSVAKSQLDIDNKKYQQFVNLYAMTQAKNDAALASLNTAKLNIAYTKYYSPVNGYITNLNGITAGEYVSVSQKIFGIVDNDNWWIDANFKETQLSRIKKGQNAKVSLDIYKHDWAGVVQGVSFASGNTFSLLPAENATGNWVKVTQRFTVRIKLKNDEKFPLRVGASSIVTIDTLKSKS